MKCQSSPSVAFKSVLLLFFSVSFTLSNLLHGSGFYRFFALSEIMIKKKKRLNDISTGVGSFSIEVNQFSLCSFLGYAGLQAIDIRNEILKRQFRITCSVRLIIQFDYFIFFYWSLSLIKLVLFSYSFLNSNSIWF